MVRHLFFEQDKRPFYAWPERDLDGRSNRKRRIREEIAAVIAAAEKARLAALADEEGEDGSLADDGADDKSVNSLNKK